MAAASSTDCMWFLQGPPRIKHNSKEFPALIYRNTSICLTCFFFMLFSTVDDCYVSGRKSVGKKPSVFLTSHSKQKFRQTTDMQAKKIVRMSVRLYVVVELRVERMLGSQKTNKNSSGGQRRYISCDLWMATVLGGKKSRAKAPPIFYTHGTSVIIHCTVMLTN